MTDLAAALNSTIREEAPAVFASLSPVGRRAYFPRDIPFQAAEARGVKYNGTIGQITDGHGAVLGVPAMVDALSGLSREDANRMLLYAPMPGLPEARERWRAWQRRGVDPGRPSSLPVSAAGLSHGLAALAELFGGPDKAVAVAAPYWGNYRGMFALRTGARMKTAPGLRDGAFNAQWIAEALSDEPDDEPAVVIVNYPSNPGGYAPTKDERRALLATLRREAERRPLVVICDDAYQGLVFEDVPAVSLFWDIADLGPRILAVKVDGATKEFTFFGGRVGFVTFGLAADAPVTTALEDKLLGLVRASIGSPVGASQVLLLQALRSPDTAAQVEAIRRRLEGRYRVLKSGLADVDPSLIRPEPFNAGCFALVEIPAATGVDAEAVRRHLISHHDAGVVAIGERHVRLAFCSLDRKALPELVHRVARGVAGLAS